MTLKEAFAVAVIEVGCPMSDAERKKWKAAERKLAGSGFCPNCACNGERVKLGRFEPATHETYGGRTCPTCEDFTVCGDQWPYENAPDYGGAFDGAAVTSDADPGL